MTGARASTVTTTQQDLAAALPQESRDLQVLCSGTGKGLRGLETVRSWDPCVWVLLAGCQQGKAIGGILTLFIVYGFLYSPFSMVFSTSPGQKGDLSPWASKPGHEDRKP